MNTADSIEVKNKRAKKMMLWFGMISMSMTFAGLTSAYVVSSSRADWLEQITLPTAFTISTILIVLSSASFHFAKKFFQKEQVSKARLALLLTLGLALAFIYFQFQGFSEIIGMGYYFTGPQSSINTSYLYVLVLLHLAHLGAGIIVVLRLLYVSYFTNNPTKHSLGFELATTFWHFLDLLWVYLYLFVSFYS
ncbi:MAG: cytochrome c oxidase subunit 3 [Flavobacteriaceae bacterium]